MAPTLLCPLCGGGKKIFQYESFQHALKTRTNRRDPLCIADFVRDCSVCSGNGWIAAETLPVAVQEAQAWRAQGVSRF